jgi:hypothetical protein
VPGASEEDCSDPVDCNCDGASSYADGDLDGWAACEDCDDAEASRNPGLPGDLDGDGYGDLATIGTSVSAGDLFLTTRVADGVVEDLAYAAFLREDASDYFEAATFGDFDGDGNVDVAAGSVTNSDGGASAGGVWVEYGPHAGTISLGSAPASWVSSAAGDYLGWSLAAIPDTNGDGYDELAMGASWADPSSRRDAGYVSVWYGE